MVTQEVLLGRVLAEHRCCRRMMKELIHRHEQTQNQKRMRDPSKKKRCQSHNHRGLLRQVCLQTKVAVLSVLRGGGQWQPQMLQRVG